MSAEAEEEGGGVGVGLDRGAAKSRKWASAKLARRRRTGGEFNPRRDSFSIKAVAGKSARDTLPSKSLN